MGRLVQPGAGLSRPAKESGFCFDGPNGSIHYVPAPFWTKWTLHFDESTLTVHFQERLTTFFVTFVTAAHYSCISRVGAASPVAFDE